MPLDNSVSVVIPVKDEAENIGRLIREIHGVMKSHHFFELVIVDDGSTDDTLTVARETARELGCPFQGLRHRRNIGQSAALRTGILYARGTLMMTLDGDGQNDPADIPRFLQQASSISAEDYCIAGFRHRRKDTPWKRFQSRVANGIRNAVLHDGVPDTGCGMKLFPRQTFLKLPWFDHGHRFLPALVRGIGGEIRIVKVNHRPRLAGTSKYSAWNRAWVGFVDLFGVHWLLSRTRVAQVVHTATEEQP